MRVIIAGSRGMSEECTWAAVQEAPFKITEVVSGTARGPDRHGELVAKVNNLLCTQFPADWDKYGKAAGYIRNKQMAEYADALIAVWDGESKGTVHMIKTMEALGKPVFVWTLKN